MFEEDPATVIKITFDDTSPEWKSLIYTVQGLTISLTVFISLSSVKIVSKLIGSLIYQRNMYDQI